MDKLTLYELIAGGEDSYTELKQELTGQRTAFANEMIAFANTEGGRILVGITDEGSIVGVQNPARVEESILSIARDNCIPPLHPAIDHVDADGAEIVVVSIPRRQGAPHENNSGQCYIRVGSTKRLASSEERARLLQLAGFVHFDEAPVAGTTVTDLDLSAFDAYYRRIYSASLETAEVPIGRMLEAMRFMVRDLDDVARLSVAGLLLFGKRPQDFLYHARISAVRWRGIEAGEEIIDRQEILGRLPEQIKRAEQFMLRNTFAAARIERAQETSQPQYPRPAFREAIVNAVAHRNYSLEGAQILLYIFDDRIEVRSPGRLPNSVTLENIRTHYHRARNETIARVLLNLGYVNTLGSGVPRMIRLMVEHTGREPDFDVLDHQFLVRLWGASLPAGWQYPN